MLICSACFTDPQGKIIYNGAHRLAHIRLRMGIPRDPRLHWSSSPSRRTEMVHHKCCRRRAPYSNVHFWLAAIGGMESRNGDCCACSMRCPHNYRLLHLLGILLPRFRLRERGKARNLMVSSTKRQKAANASQSELAREPARSLSKRAGFSSAQHREASGRLLDGGERAQAIAVNLALRPQVHVAVVRLDADHLLPHHLAGQVQD
jgi:hypothetical protein